MYIEVNFPWLITAIPKEEKFSTIFSLYFHPLVLNGLKGRRIVHVVHISNPFCFSGVQLSVIFEEGTARSVPDLNFNGVTVQEEIVAKDADFKYC